MNENKEYVITRLDEWSDELWNEVVQAVEDTVVAVADDWERNKEEN